MKNSFKLTFDNELAMQQWVAANKLSFKVGVVCYLEGDLGAGKTSFSRALLQALGYDGRVKSPTYTLLEVYELQALRVCHFDLYRLGEAEELLFLGADDYHDATTLWLVEWPVRGAGYLPPADVVISIAQQQEQRVYHFEAASPSGEKLVASLHN